MDKLRTTEVVLEDIKKLVKTKGYIYAFCMVLFEDFHINPEKLHEIDNRARLNINEASLLQGFLIQNEINFSTPDSPEVLIHLKRRTYELLEELHSSFMLVFVEKLQKTVEKEHKIENFRDDQKDFFGKGDMLSEPIFYSGTGVYDFQYLDFLERKYKYDKPWLIKNKNFDIEESKNIVIKIKEILQKKSKKVHLYPLNEKLPQIIEDFKKEKPDEDWEKFEKETRSMMELHQYVNLFFEHSTGNEDLSNAQFREEGWESFYKGLLDLFIIKKTDFDNKKSISTFLNNFSLFYEDNLNSNFQGIGHFNLVNAKPIIQLDENKYFIPIVYSLFEAIYESPFYWMWKEDKSYRDQLGINRGKTGEEITYDFLSRVFGKGKTFKSVKITSKKGQDDTDIDVLCILGSKVLCVQVKSKKLTLLSRTGDDKQLYKDFQGAVQDAYSQGLVSRRKILDRNAKFTDENGKDIHISEEIDEAYILGITTENYPSLTHQSNIMLDKEDNDPFPLFSTIFDLELMVHYLSDPYDFLYYIRQRTSLMDFFRAAEEMSFLGYHLDQKLWKIPSYDGMTIDSRVEKVQANPCPSPSSIRTCGFPAYGFPAKFIESHIKQVALVSVFCWVY